MDIVVGEESSSLVNCVFVAIGTEASLVDDHVGDVLGVLDRGARVVHLLVAFALLRVETELDLVNTVREAKHREVSSLDHRDDFIELAVFLVSLIVSGHRHEVSHLLSPDEVVKDDTLVHLVVEGDLVQGFLEVVANKLIVSERFLWQEIQVLLERLTDQVALKTLEESLLGGLGSEHGEHSPGDADDWEVGLILQVVVASPLDRTPNCLQVLLIFVALFCITWDVETVDVLELLLEGLLVESVVDRDDTGAGSLQEIGVRALKEALEGETEVVVPLFGERLREDTEDGLVGLGSDVVARIEKDRLALVAAKMVCSVTLYKNVRKIRD